MSYSRSVRIMLPANGATYTAIDKIVFKKYELLVACATDTRTVEQKRKSYESSARIHYRFAEDWGEWGMKTWRNIISRKQTERVIINTQSVVTPKISCF